MKKRELKRIFAKFLMVGASATLLTACNSGGDTKEPAETTEETAATEEVTEEAADDAEKEEVNYAQVFEEAKTELDKAKEGKEVDFDKVTDLYTTNLQSLVQERDAELESKHDEQITAALQAGKDGSMDKVVAKQVFDKLMQKVFYTTMKQEFKEVEEGWADKEEVKAEVEEAKEFYAILQSTVEKRDAAYGTTMVDVIAGGFDEIDKAVEADDLLAFQLGKQVVDKTLIKTFYFATGAIPNGYATKLAEEAKKDEKVAKVEQAEGWAFYQSVSKYLGNHAPEEAAFIEKQFDLQTDVKTVDAAQVNKAFVRGFAQTAIDEYTESIELWGEDKSVITALEGALFIDVIGQDIKASLGEEAYTKLTEQAQQYLEAAKAKDKAAGEPVLKEMEATLQTVIEKAK
ncbi:MULTISPECIES: hypothetical protein [Bacillaceae]|uniref:DUF3829 domain-containing protein n=1 Tax=Domibacillus aminovorans TaxID=29332 RepID=A0A177KN36_9BACI|nr:MULTISPECIES: hypothetical protein [Bacillaceae]OAH54779.1 hypothetical protein AWH48_09355 [Domibacillus aminovorans]